MSVLGIIRKLQEKDKEIRLLILGLDNAGKTTILHRFLDQDINQISPTVGFNIKTIQYIPSQHNANQNTPPNSPHTDPTSPNNTNIPHQNAQLTSNSHHHDQQYNITIWDVGGQSTIRSFWSNYFAHTDGLVWVIDSTDISRFDLCVETLKSVLKQERLSGTSLLILANKQDVQFAYSLEQVAKMLGLNTRVGKLSQNTSENNTGTSQEGDIGGNGDDSDDDKSAKNEDDDDKDDEDDDDDDEDDEDDNSFNHQDQPLSSILSHHWFLQGCSARANTGIKEGFRLLIDDIIKRLYLLDS